MVNWWLFGIAGVAIVVSLFFEDAREWYADSFSYIISFEWLSDGWEFVTGLFENLNEFSVGGLVFGVAVVGLIYLFRDYMISPFLVNMGVLTGTFWMVVTYLGCGVFGYLVGKRLFDE